MNNKLLLTVTVQGQILSDQYYLSIMLLLQDSICVNLKANRLKFVNQELG